MVDTLLAAIARNPADLLGWLALADALEERGEADRAELTRLTAELRKGYHFRTEARMQQLLRDGVLPCVPTITNSIGMKLVLIPAGKFMMGSPHTDELAHPNDLQHEEVIPWSIWMGAYPVLRREFHAVVYWDAAAVGAASAAAVVGVPFKELPVTRVSCDDAVQFCKRLSDLPEEKEAGRVYWVPFEREWEYACRAGTTTAYNTGDDEAALACAGWYAAPDGWPTAYPREVGQKAPNAWGLYDMHGNVWELCDSPPPAPPESPEAEMESRVIRGGCWTTHARHCTAFYRRWARGTATVSDSIGFRVAMERR